MSAEKRKRNTYRTVSARSSSVPSNETSQKRRCPSFLSMIGKAVHVIHHKILLNIMNYVREYFDMLKEGENRLEFSDYMRILFNITNLTCLPILMPLLPFEGWSDYGMIIKSKYD